MGQPDTYEYIHDNPMIQMRGIDYTNNPQVIAQHEKQVAINAALSIDLTAKPPPSRSATAFTAASAGKPTLCGAR
jgi:acyl-CoA hydrolase